MTTNHSERKKLLKRLRGFCAIMGDDLQKLDDELRTRIDVMIDALETPVKVVLAGLSDANHHALATALVGAPLLETDNAAQKCPRLNVSAGKEARTLTTVGGRDRVFRGSVVDKLVSVGATDLIRVELPTLKIPNLDLSILPTYESQEDRSGYLLDLVGDGAIIVWTSQASTPWDANERRLWFTVPDILKTRSILVLTGEADQAILDEKREMVSDDFAHIVTIDTDAKDDGRALLDVLEIMMGADDATLFADALALRHELDAIPIGTVQAAPAPIPAPATVAPAAEEPAADPVEALRTLIATEARTCLAAVDGMKNDDTASVFDAMGTLLSGMTAALRGDVTLPRDHAALLADVGEATDLIGLLSYESGTIAVQEAADLMRQVVVDVLDRLDTVIDDTASAEDDTRIRKAS